MQIKAEQNAQPLTCAGALAVLWCVKLRLGQYPIYISPEPEKQEGKIG